MYNKSLEYLKSYNPEEVVNEKDVSIRKKIYPFLRIALILSNPYHLHKVRRIEPPKDRKVIYCPTHGFKDDLVNAMITINKPAYTLFGSIDQFYNTIDGKLANLFGVAIVDRDDPKSRAASLPKMERVMDYDIDGIVFPEGAWNLTPNEIVMKLFNLVYDLSRKNNAVLVPLATHIQIREWTGTIGKIVRILRKTPIFKKLGRHCYSIQDNAIDIAAVGIEEEKRASTELESLFNSIRNENTKKYSSQELIEQLVPMVEKEQNGGLIGSDSYKLAKSIYDIVCHYWKEHQIDDERMSKITALVDRWIDAKRNNSYDIFDTTISLKDCFSDTFKTLPYRIGREKAKEELRDKMATPKLELIINYSNFTRKELENNGQPLEQQWGEEKRRLKAEVEYYIEEKEKNYPFRDKNVVSDNQAFSVIDKVEPTKDNAFVLAKTKN